MGEFVETGLYLMACPGKIDRATTKSVRKFWLAQLRTPGNAKCAARNGILVQQDVSYQSAFVLLSLLHLYSYVATEVKNIYKNRYRTIRKIHVANIINIVQL
jgi:hypothetical protein